MYFENFPHIYYDFEINGVTQLKVVKDITQNVRVRKAVLENVTLYDEYDIRDGETPEIIAAKVYGSPTYHWVIMLCNQRFDYLKDFPMSQRVLEEYVADTYENPYGTHHYELDGIVVDSGTPEAYAVSNYEYEDRLNESKRRIKLISPDLLSSILLQFKDLI